MKAVRWAYKFFFFFAFLHTFRIFPILDNNFFSEFFYTSKKISEKNADFCISALRNLLF